MNPLDNSSLVSGSSPAMLAGQNKPNMENSPSVNSSTQIHNVGELQKKAPDLYAQIEQFMAYNICTQMKRHQDRVIAAMKKARQEQQGG